MTVSPSRYGPRLHVDPEQMREWLQTLTYSQIGEMLGKSKQWVGNYVRDKKLIGVSPPGSQKVPPANAARPPEAELRALGNLTQLQIAQKYGVKCKTVRGWCRMYGIRLKLPKRPEAQEWRESCRAMTSRQIMAHYGISESTVWQWSSDLGISPVRCSSKPGGHPANKIPSEDTSGLSMDWVRKRLSGAEGINGYRFSMMGGEHV